MSEPAPPSSRPASAPRWATFWWYMLGASIGGTAFFMYICLLEGPPPFHEFLVYVWPGSCILASIVSIRMLKRCYRDDLEAFKGFWQLSIVDLYAVTFFTALWMAAYRELWPHRFVPGGIAISLSMGLGYTICLLISARKGYRDSRSKIPYAAALLLTSLGLAAAGALILVCSFLILYRGEVSYAWDCIVFVLFYSQNKSSFHSVSDLLPIRPGLMFLPVGLLLQRIVSQRANRPQSSP